MNRLKRETSLEDVIRSKQRHNSASRSVFLIERLRFTFMPNGKREFVPRDQVFPLIVVNCSLLQLENK